MKKKTIANLVMAAIIVVIAAAGILTAGYIRGWFDKADETQAVLTDIRGVVNLRRDGVLFPVESDTVLRSGDQLTSGNGASASIRIGDGYLVLGSQADIVISNPAAGSFDAEINAGELFVNTGDMISLSFEARQFTIADAVVSLSVRTGAQSVYVYYGAVESGGKTAEAGQQLSFAGDTLEVGSVVITALNDFLIDQVRKANETMVLCFTVQDLDQLAADRQQALQDLLNSQTPEPSRPSESQPTATESPATVPPETGSSDETVPSGTEPPETKPTSPAPTEPKPTEPPATKPTETNPPETEPQTAVAGTCVITIRCDTVLNNMDELDPAKAEFVPSDGVILPVVSVDFYEGETVFDVLNRVCAKLNIQLEYSWTPGYGSYYVEGINNLYEFDCGMESGWMYKVNEWFPNYGCSSYQVSDGDVIVWCYTCHGYGNDVGALEW